MAIWYPRYPGDYARDTQDLSTSEHGMLTLLLDTYYANGPIPADWYRLYRITKVGHSIKTRHQLQSIVARFFTLDNGHWINARADKERAKMLARSSRAKGLIDKRWLKVVK